MRVIGSIALVMAVLVLSGAALADVLVMKDGRRIEGVVLEETQTKVKIKTGLGVLEFERSKIESIERKKTKSQQFDERFEVAKTANEFHELGIWAEENRLRKQAKKAMARAIEVDPEHVKARTWLGFVRYRDEWMTQEERETRMAADEEADMLARGFVKYEERWVTPEEKAKLEAGFVLHEGSWYPFAVAQRKKGLELFEDRWIPRAEAQARLEMKRVSEVAKVELNVHVCEHALLAGNGVLVQYGNGRTQLYQRLTDGQADVSGAAGDQDGHVKRPRGSGRRTGTGPRRRPVPHRRRSGR